MQLIDMNKLNCHVIGSYLFEWIRRYVDTQ